MAREIEHKFLVHVERLPKPLPKGKKILQGYLCARPAVRIRLLSHGGKSKAFLTVKGSGLRVREEFEYEIPVNDAKRLLKLCGKNVLSKTRREIGGWELDEFHDRHKGLWLAEYELPDSRAKLPKLPPWVAREVTGDPCYTNSHLAGK